MDITEIIKIVITLIAALISAFVIPWLRGKTTEQQREKLLAWVKIAVAAAEQLFSREEWEDKKDYVQLFLASKGYAVDTDEIENAIEAEVLRLHNELYRKQGVLDD